MSSKTTQVCQKIGIGKRRSLTWNAIILERPSTKSLKKHRVVAVQFTPKKVKQISRSKYYGCIGIDINPGSIGWAYVDLDGNLKAHGQIPLQMGLPNSKQQAQIVDACLHLASAAATYACPIVCENLDFSEKKQQLREKGRKYARMLSGWPYSELFKQLQSILANHGIKLIKVDPAYTSVIGMVKYARQYALPSDCAAAVAIARRGMRLTENIPATISAYLEAARGGGFPPTPEGTPKPPVVATAVL
ncbi:MAG: IS200/IS605 family accessory protein TnpB-related protein [Brasilonema sp.]